MKKGSKDEAGLLTVEEAAERLKFKASTIRSWILLRRHLEIVRIGRSVRIPARSVQKLIDDNTIPPTEKVG